MIDFRSDTVTKPTPEMRQAMFDAPVGDDVFSEDPTVNLLQEKAAAMFGMEAAIFCASGTQTNQVAINVHVKPGGEIICHEESHIYKYEGGGIAKNSGASVRLLQGNRGRVTAEQVASWVNNPEDVHLPMTELISLEDTANRGGGAIYDFEEIQKIRKFAVEHQLPLHLDGARLFNSLVETGIPVKEYAAQFDSISICLSKGLGAPVGSLLLGKKDFIHRARRVRKVFGGGMRQAGFLAAAGIYALENHVERLKEDHRNAKLIEAALLKQDWILDVIPVETNIVVGILRDAGKREEIIQRFKEHGILIMAFGPGMIRIVTHLDVSESDISKTCDVIDKI